MQELKDNKIDTDIIGQWILPLPYTIDKHV